MNATKYQLGFLFTVFLLGSCGSSSSNSKPEGTVPIMTQTTPSIEQVGNATIETPKSIKSIYTSLDLENCKVLETSYEKRGGQALRCKGYQDIPLYVTKWGGRFDVDAGVPNSSWTTARRPYNSIGDTVEWRIHDGKPVAIILRYNFTTDGFYPTRSSELAVTSVGREGSPGCLIEWVKADAQPNQNTAARQIADRKAESFNCGSNLSAKP